MRIVRPVLCAAVLVIGGALMGELGSSGAAFAAGGHNYFVAPGGTNTSCTVNSAVHPFGKIQDAINCALADGTTPTSRDTIHIAAGTYHENLDIYPDVNLLGAGQSSTAIDGGQNGSPTVGVEKFAVV